MCWPSGLFSSFSALKWRAVYWVMCFGCWWFLMAIRAPPFCVCQINSGREWETESKVSSSPGTRHNSLLWCFSFQLKLQESSDSVVIPQRKTNPQTTAGMRCPLFSSPVMFSLGWRRQDLIMLCYAMGIEMLCFQKTCFFVFKVLAWYVMQICSTFWTLYKQHTVCF